MRFRVEYQQPETLIADHEQQFVHGGLLVRGEPPPGVELFQAAELEMVIGGDTFILTAQVVQILPGLGVALTFAANDARILAAVSLAREGTLPPHVGETPVEEPPVEEPPVEEPPVEEPPRPPPAGQTHATLPEKIQLALHGTRDDRAAILRDINKQLHPYVLKNPNLQLDEITAIVKMTTVSPELLKQICERREWVQRPEIAIALIRNPKVPVQIAVRLIDYVTAADLRQLAKDSRIRDPISRAARKKVLGE